MPRLKNSGGETQRWRREMKACHESTGMRLALLQTWAEVKVKPRGGGSTAERRAKARACLKAPRLKLGQCWACAGFADLVRHHVIQLQNGGTNWHLNTVKICEACHAAIHPWLASRSGPTA